MRCVISSPNIQKFFKINLIRHEQVRNLLFTRNETRMLLLGGIEKLKLLLLSFILGTHIIANNYFPIVLLLFPPKARYLFKT